MVFYSVRREFVYCSLCVRTLNMTRRRANPGHVLPHIVVNK